MTTTTQNLGMPLLVAGQLQPEVTINGDLNTIDAALGTAATAFGYNVNGSSGLTFAYFGGTVLENGLPVTVAAGSVTLTGSATNYVQRTPAGVVSANTTGYTAGYLPMATVVTSATNITTVTDTRPAFLTKGGRLVIGIGAPTAVSVTTATTGGSLAAGTYGYRVSALYPWGESVACAEIQVTTTGTTSENTITWTLPAGATAAKVYGRTVGGELLIAQVAAGTSTYTDTGSVTPSGALPTGTFTLTEAETNAAILSLEGAIAGATTVEFPLRPQVWVVSNETTGAFVTTCTTASGTGVAISQGTAEVLYCNGINMVSGNTGGDVVSFNGRAGAVTLEAADVTGAMGFPFGQSGSNALYWTTPNWGAAFSGNTNDKYGDGQNLLVANAPAAASGYTFSSTDNRLFVFAITTSGTLVIRFPQGSVDINTYGTNGGIQGKNFQATNSQTLTGTTAGSIVSSMPEQGVAKKFVAYANGYENDSTTAQTITFPTAFSNPPVVTTNTSGLSLSVSTTTLTINAPDNTTSYSGVIIVEGI